MDAIEIRLKRRKLYFNLILVLTAILASSYFLYATDIFPQTETRLFGTIAIIILFYFVFWRTLKRLMKNAPVLTADDAKLRFEDKNGWRQIAWTEILSLEFKKGYDGYRISKKLTVGTSDGKTSTIDLNDLDVDWDDLQSKLHKFNRT